MNAAGRPRLQWHPRRGLAPVELVLALPVWMLLASAMVIVANLGAWKVRGHLAAREAAARSVWPRTRAGETNVPEWSRPSAIMQVWPASSPAVTDPLGGHSVVRGPQIGEPGTEMTLAVDGSVMAPQSGAVAGEAFLNEPPAIWGRSGVRNRFAREYPLLDGNFGQWDASTSGGLRAPRVWMLPPIE